MRADYKKVLASKDFAFRSSEAASSSYIEMLQLALIMLRGELEQCQRLYGSKLVVLRHEIFRKPGVRLMASAQADLTEVCEVVEQVSSSG